MTTVKHALIIEIGTQLPDQPTHYPLSAQLDGKVLTGIRPHFVWDVPADIRRLMRRYRDGLSLPEIEQLGSFLYTALFHAKMDEQSLQTAIDDFHMGQKGQPLRIVLRIQDDELSRVPWETLYNGDTFMAVQTKTPIVRQLSQLDDQSFDQINTIRVLFVTASPDSHAKLDGEETFDAIKQRVEAETTTSWQRFFRLQQEVRVRALHNATIGSLTEVLQDHQYDIICFAVHGYHDHIVLEKNPRRGQQPDKNDARPRKEERVSAKALSDILKNVPRQTVQLVMFIACSTDAMAAPQQGQNNPLAGFAREFIKATQLPVVVAMQSDVNVYRANTFTVAFFQHLANLHSVDSALTSARLAMQTRFKFDAPSRDVFAPVMYLQSDGGQLFRPDRLQFWVRRLIPVVFIALIAAVVYSQLARFQSDLLNQDNLIVQNYANLQRLGHLSQFDRIELDFSPSSPLITPDSIWLSERNGNRVHRRSIQNPGDAPAGWIYEVGSQPSRPVSSGTGEVYVSSAFDGTLTRLTSDGNTPPQTEFIGFEIDTPIVIDDDVWLFSNFESTLFRVTPDFEVVSFETERRTFQPLITNEWIWVFPNGEGEVVAVHLQTQAVIRFPVEALTRVFVTQDQVWGVTDEHILLRFQPDDTQPIADSIPLSFAISDVAVADGRLVVATTSNNILMIDLLRGDVVDFYALATPISAMRLIDDELLILQDEQLLIFDAPSRALINTVNVSGVTNLVELLVTESAFWLPVNSSNVLIQIDRTALSEVNRLTLCEGPTAPHYDGTSLWMSCPDEKSLVVGPERIFYTGDARIRDTVYDHTPIVTGNQLWSVQEGAGVVSLHDLDTPQQIDSINLDAPILPLLPDQAGTVVYTATGGRIPSSVWRLTSTESTPFLRSLVGLSPTYEIRAQSHPIDGEVQSLQLISNQLWIIHSRFDELGNTDNLTILDADTFAVLHTGRYGVVITGVVAVDDIIWVSASDQDRGLVYQIDAATLRTIGDPFTPEEVQSAPLAGVVIGSKLYFAFTSISFEQIGELIQIVINPNAEMAIAPIVYPFDLTTQQWEEPLNGINLAYNPVVDEPFLWLRPTINPVVGRLPETNLGQQYILDTTSGELQSVQICANASEPYPTQQFMVIGCNQSGEALYLFSRGQLPNADDLTLNTAGLRPMTPLEHEQGVYITFQDSNTLIILDARTGDLLQTMQTGSKPSRPFLIGDDIWVHNTSAGYLQHLQAITGNTRLSTNDN